MVRLRPLVMVLKVQDNADQMGLVPQLLTHVATGPDEATIDDSYYPSTFITRINYWRTEAAVMIAGTLDKRLGTRLFRPGT